MSGEVIFDASQRVRDSSRDAKKKEDVSGRNNTRRMQVKAAVEELHRCGEQWVSARQVWGKLYRDGVVEPPSDVFGSYQPRLNELVQEDCLERSCERSSCPVTGNQVYMYRVVGW